MAVFILSEIFLNYYFLFGGGWGIQNLHINTFLNKAVATN